MIDLEDSFVFKFVIEIFWVLCSWILVDDKDFCWFVLEWVCR